MPRTFDAEDENAHYASLFAHWPAAERGIPISRALSRARHPAVPAYMSDIATKVAHSAFLMGPVKCKGLRAKCHCDRTTDETVDHGYQKCARVARLWTLVLAAWARVTGETRLKASDTQVTCLGDRTGTWVDETEQSEFGAYSEPWAVIHKATLWVIKQERDKAVAPKAKTPRSAAAMYNRVQVEVQKVVGDLWARACEAARTGKQRDAVARFKGKWVATGFVQLRAYERHAQIVAFSSAATHERRRALHADVKKRQQQREQEHAPPTILPPGTIAVYTDGSAEKRSKDDPGSAGYGVCVIDHCNDGNKDEQGEVRAKRSNRFDQQVSSDFYLHTWKFHFHSQDQIQSRRLSQLFSGFHTKINDILPISSKVLQVLET